MQRKEKDMQRKERGRNVEEIRDIICLEEREIKKCRGKDRGVRGKRQRQKYRSKKSYIEKEEGKYRGKTEKENERG